MKSLLGALVAVAGLVAPAFGQGIIADDVFDNDTFAQYLDYANQNFMNQNNVTVASTGADFNNAISASLIAAGFNGLATAAQTAAYTPTSPGLGGSFGVHSTTGQASSTVTATGGWQAEYAVGTVYGRVLFSVNQLTTWSIAGNVWATTAAINSGVSEGSHLIRFSPYLSNTFYVVDSAQANNGVGNYNTNFSYGGTLVPGTYIYEYLVWSQYGGNNMTPVTLGLNSTSGISITLTLVAVPEPATLAAVAPALLAAASLRSHRRRALRGGH